MGRKDKMKRSANKQDKKIKEMEKQLNDADRAKENAQKKFLVLQARLDAIFAADKLIIKYRDGLENGQGDTMSDTDIQIEYLLEERDRLKEEIKKCNDLLILAGVMAGFKKKNGQWTKVDGKLTQNNDHEDPPSGGSGVAAA